ncbi:MAG: hypothetical protein J6A92_05190 [Lachnospiraceae bacterium]|nr:hypothetical protein [Lachnospiraceae bacterium]
MFNRKIRHFTILFLIFTILFYSIAGWNRPKIVEPKDQTIIHAEELQVDIGTVKGSWKENESKDLDNKENQKEESQEDFKEEIQKQQEDKTKQQEESENTNADTEELVKGERRKSIERSENIKDGEGVRREEETESPDEGETETPEEETETPDEGETPEEETEMPGEGATEAPGEADIDKPGDTDEEDLADTETEEEIEDAGIVTDLYDRIIVQSELQEDLFSFYVYYADPTVNANIRVNYKHESESGTGTYLTAKDGKDYQTKLALGKNYITVYYSQSNGERTYTRYVITYQAKKADEENPEEGEHPPSIETNLDGWSGEIKTNEFTFVVKARTWEDAVIYENHIQVALDGSPIVNPTGKGTYEYVLSFQRPETGDYSYHTVTVLAWDDDGNSKFVKYTITYHAVDEGEELGAVTVIIDATTVSCGIVDEYEVNVKAGDTAATALLLALDELGYTYVIEGTAQANFYLRSIERADAFRGCAVSDRLKALLERDGIGFLAPGNRDKLGEFDFTAGSGWMYFIDGEICPGKSMYAWVLNGGETVHMRFTLSYGKDLGAIQEGTGSLSSYCAVWLNGTITELEHSYEESNRVEPEGTTEGYVEYKCSKCGETRQEVILPPEGSEETENEAEGEAAEGEEAEEEETEGEEVPQRENEDEGL